MAETRKLAAILAADMVGYSRLAGSDEDRTLARLRALRSDLVDPTIAVHHGRVVKRTGDGILVEFRSVVDAVRCAIEVQNGMVERNGGLPSERRIEFRVGIHLGDVVEETDGDLMGDGVNIAARLEGICLPNAICLSEDAYRQVRSRLDLAVTDLGDKDLKNIAEKVRVFSLEVGKPAQAKAVGPPIPTEAAGPPRLSIVVLPFANIGGDPEQEYFVDGVTESLTTDLSRISGSFVIARNTAFTYKGKHVDVKQIGRELNVRYVLEGSVQRGGNRMRVNVQLIDAETGNHLWAERFDKPVADLFDMQDEIVARLANQLRSELIAVEARWAERVQHPESIDLYFRGMASVHIGGSPANLSQARDFFEQAVTLNPDNVEALVGLAHCDAYLGGGLFGPDRTARLTAAATALDRVLSLAPNNASAHQNVGHLMVFTNRATQALSELERALKLDPNLAAAHASIGLAKITLGRAEETERHIEEALRLSPLDVTAYLWVAFAGFAKACLGLDEEAVTRLRRAIELNRNYPIAHFWLGAALARLGRIEEAGRSVRVGLTFDPGYSIRNARAGAMSDNAIYLKQREHIYEAMRKAGVPP
jgi:TolB-like protein/class 3 adenylate cyclase/Flp pilus assembly protein TadD